MAIAGAIRRLRPDGWRRRLHLAAASLTLKLLLLIGIFVALPIVLYGQFESADRQNREMVAQSLRRDGWLIAQGLAGLVKNQDNMPPLDLNAALEKYAGNGTILKLMFQPKPVEWAEPRFFFIASAPRVSAEQMKPDLDMLERHGILASLANSCSWDKPLDIRYRQLDGAEEILTSIVPIQTDLGCWALISANDSTTLLNSGFGKPYWQTDSVRMAALIYLLFAALAVLVALNVRRALRQFRRVAREIRRGGMGVTAFADRNTLPELASVAIDFDRLVEDLHRAASNIRRAAEDNAHAVKTPLAVIRSALQPIKTAVPPEHTRAQRAVQLIESSLSRLNNLISLAQRMGNDTADFIEAPKLRINLTSVVTETLNHARRIAPAKRIRFLRHLQRDVHVRAPENILDIVIENILDNAVGFTRPGGTITTSLSRTNLGIELTVDDDGPGVDPDKIDYIFERHFSFRPEGGMQGEPEHAGLGLWIVRQHTEALGGRVTASNRDQGGLRIHIILPPHG